MSLHQNFNECCIIQSVETLDSYFPSDIWYVTDLSRYGFIIQFFNPISISILQCYLNTICFEHWL